MSISNSSWLRGGLGEDHFYLCDFTETTSVGPSAANQFMSPLSKSSTHDVTTFSKAVRMPVMYAGGGSDEQSPVIRIAAFDADNHNDDEILVKHEPLI